MRRPNFTALLFSFLLVAVGALAALRSYPVIPAFGTGPAGGDSAAGLARTAPGLRVGCRQERRTAQGGYRFSPDCAGQAPSADGSLYVVKNAGSRAGIGLVRGGTGESIADLGTLDDGRPFTLFWSPAGHRFFVNQQRPDGTERIRIFTVRGTLPIEQPALEQAIIREVAQRRACRIGAIDAVGSHWIDARRIMLRVNPRTGACPNMRPLYLLGNSETGTIEVAGGN